jgi:hypothetical protein
LSFGSHAGISLNKTWKCMQGYRLDQNLSIVNWPPSVLNPLELSTADNGWTQIRAWMVPVAAARLAEQIEGESGPLLALISDGIKKELKV